MHAGAGQESTFDPVLKVCEDSECNTILATDDDSGPGSDAQLTFTFQTTVTFFIEVSEKMGRAGDFRLILYNDPTKRVPLGIGAKPLHDSGLEGEGVIVGVLDSGIDWCHDDFIDDTTGKSRIRFLWDQTLTPALSGEISVDVGTDGDAANDYGVEYTASQINAALNTDDCDQPDLRTGKSAAPTHLGTEPMWQESRRGMDQRRMDKRRLENTKELRQKPIWSS
ncbi:hypothetical protein [Candidatus Manganitrophus noduliformans]|uniref:Peptidase S8/S53 domain-containing protein n=1 Tax=Candidatus Manganitrophus noduliformans TaxID=2606439 RepID=A0A7X6DRH6_9BACT|nr:hypothetical protein [Candidatus Manganitrophus noduliformans]NKE71999.1 hypothetical protein [Candidatus Manganitrophus noduliformans]